MAVLANQIISWTVCDKKVEKSEFLKIIKKAYPFRKLNDTIIDDLLELLPGIRQLVLAEERQTQTVFYQDGPRINIQYRSELLLSLVILLPVVKGNTSIVLRADGLRDIKMAAAEQEASGQKAEYEREGSW